MAQTLYYILCFYRREPQAPEPGHSLAQTIPSQGISPRGSDSPQTGSLDHRSVSICPFILGCHLISLQVLSLAENRVMWSLTDTLPCHPVQCPMSVWRWSWSSQHQLIFLWLSILENTKTSPSLWNAFIFFCMLRYKPSQTT